ncbi:MAG: tRNA (N(6)-L-threonylcarbamoyladenosine(37)-C(2))-methylthiotransferase MtaB [Candidatus Zixiibacteriota bacterium]
MKASLHTLGCRLNQSETAIIAKTLADRGFEIVEWGEPADLTVINTCTVTEQADSKCRQAVRQAIRKNPDAFVAVVGCYSQMAVDIISHIEGVDLIVGNEQKLRVTDYIDGLKKNAVPVVIHSSKMSADDFTIESVGIYENHTRANLKLQDGCDFVCSFCIIPRARGRSRSRKYSDVIAEAEKLASMGFREIVLTGVNIGTYQSDDHSFLDVIRNLEGIDGIDRIRISSIELTTIKKDLVEYMATSKKLCSHLHIPLQSGDDSILDAMRRKHAAKDFADFVEWSVNSVPGIGIGTDIMVGFPGETDDQFKNTKKFLADLPIEYFHVFVYSDRADTPASRLPNKVDHQIKKLRSRILIEMGERKKYAFCEKYIGTPVDVLFETAAENVWVGYTDNYMRVRATSDLNLRNEIRTVVPDRIEGDTLIGEIV